ncbi:MAG: CBS domain-containing protein [Hydrogenophilaceae bacterium]|nr:CBS domain-containing protein [Hydrogenophilaceae bacterium]
MFSVYGVTGQTFRGTLEEFLAVPRLHAGRDSRGIAREGEELGPEMVRPGRPGPEAEPYRQAAQAYRRMLHVTTDRGPVLHAYQLMSRDVLTLRPETTVEAAWNELFGAGLGQAPVLDKTHRIIGIVTAKDLLTAINLEDGKVRDVLPQTVADIMTSPVVSADPVSDIRRVARVLLEHHLPGMPVVNERHELVGIITRSDILRALVNDPPLSLWA